MASGVSSSQTGGIGGAAIFLQREEKSASLFHHVMFGFDPRIWCHHT
jgi:hypothetical protein